MAPNPEYPLSGQFLSGATNIPGWLQIISFPAYNAIVILDYSTASAIVATRWPGFWGLYNLFLFAKPSLIASGGGLLVQGCPYSSRYPWLPYNDNPNVGRRKRQVSECEKLLNDRLIDFIGGENAKEIILQICNSDHEFITNNIDFMQLDGDMLVENMGVIQEVLNNDCAEINRDGTQTEPIKENVVQPVRKGKL